MELAGAPIDDHSLQVDILIGSDHYWKLGLKQGKDGPVATDTILGWVFSGPVAIAGQADEMHSLVVHTYSTVYFFWDLESFGVR